MERPQNADCDASDADSRASLETYNAVAKGFRYSSGRTEAR
jgi:hypothetical protein